jgi:predicted Zn finger-like uncharacterized protein
MDVRCDRCQTEYELDDESVAGSGASVQCTTCGHTFVVSRNGDILLGAATPPSGVPGGGLPSSGTPPANVGSLGSQSSAAPPPTASRERSSTPPPVPEWVLTTEEGQSHRLRDLTTLQKWVVERRVGRNDRVSFRGGVWRALGDVEELRPFFDVVAQADRQTASNRETDPARSVRPTLPATPRKVQNAVRPHMSPDLDDDDVLSSSENARRSRGDAARFIDTDIGTDDDLSIALRPRRTGLKVIGGVLFVGLVGGAAYVGFRDPHGFRLASGAAAPPSVSAGATGGAAAAAPIAAAPAAPTPSAALPTLPTAPAAVAPVPNADAAAPALVPAVPAAAAPPAPVAALAPAAAAAPIAPAPAAPAPAAAPSAAAVAPDGKPRTYERLVAEADHSLENGQTAKAQKLYEDALKLQPNGVAAMTGTAYVLMDRRRPLAAIGLFKQALSNAPNFAPALFGLGEAYRGQGDAAQAIDAYKRYLEQSPTGPDAPAARRQVKDLSEVAASSSRNQGPTAVVPATSPRTEPQQPPPTPAP